MTQERAPTASLASSWLLLFLLLLSTPADKFTAHSFTMFEPVSSHRALNSVKNKSRSRYASHPYPTTSPFQAMRKVATPLCYAVEDDLDLETMRNEIDSLRKEAKNRIDALSSKMDKISFERENNVVANGNKPSAATLPPTPIQKTAEQRRKEKTEAMYASAPLQEQREEEDRFIDDAMKRRREREKAAREVLDSLPPGMPGPSEEMCLLDNTHWRIVLNIGREPDSWMPKTWGVSGERLLLNLEVEFTPEQLYDREVFLRGVRHAKVLHVVNNELTLGPSMTEGSRKVRVSDGGWKVGAGQGPMGTDLLRFYVELETEVRHQGGDVYCPAGRIYCTCGYFPQKETTSFNTKRMELRKKQRELEEKERGIWEAMDADKSLLGLNKLKLRADLFQLGKDARQLQEDLKENMVRNPEKSVLRMSRKKDVALTREGGVCCKVTKSVTYEYHILGKFGLAAVEPKDDDDDNQ